MVVVVETRCKRCIIMRCASSYYGAVELMCRIPPMTIALFRPICHSDVFAGLSLFSVVHNPRCPAEVWRSDNWKAKLGEKNNAKNEIYLH